MRARRHSENRLHQYLRQRPAHGARPHHRAEGADSGARDHRRSDRSRARRGIHQSRRPGFGAVQHRLRALPQLQRGQDRHLPERESGAAGRGLRLRRYGRLGRRAGRVRDGAVRRFQPAEVSGQGAGDGEDQRPDAALRHLPDRLSRRGDGGRRARARSSTSRAAGRWAWRARRPASCWARPW